MMKRKNKIYKACRLILVSLWIIFGASEGFGALKLKSVYPTLGLIEQGLNVKLGGTGFDARTRVSMSLDSGNKIAIMGSADTPGFAEGVAVSGTTAYVADYGGGLQIIDVADPKNPSVIGSLDTPGGAKEISLAGTKVYVVYKGLQIIDVSRPQAPVMMGSADIPGRAEGIAVAGDIAYVADPWYGLHLIDVSRPESPEIITSVSTPGNTYGVAVAGHTAYVADGDKGLQIVDVADPKNPRIVGSALMGNAIGIAVIQDTAYVTDNSRGCLQVVDVSNPTHPVIIKSVDTPGAAHSITVADNTAYVLDYGGGLQVIDVTDPKNPEIIGFVGTPGSSYGIAVIGETAYVADGAEGLQVIDVSSPAISTIIGAADISPGSASGIAVVGDTAYIADEYGGGLKIIDVTDPKTPQVTGSLSETGSARDIAVSGNMAYIIRIGGLQIIDISDPAHPKTVGNAETPGEAQSITVSGTRAYIADHHQGLHIIDVGNPAQPEIIGTADTPGSATGVAVVGTTAYVADYYKGLQIIDVSNPAQPEIIGAAALSGEARKVAVAGNTAYITNDSEGLQIIDVTNPAQPELLGVLDMPDRANGIIVIENMVYTVNDSKGLQVIDAGNPANPTLIGSVDTPGYARGIAVVGNLAYVADSANGLVIVPVPIEIGDVAVENDTSISLSLPTPRIAGHYTLRVFNGTEHHELNGAVTFSDGSVTFSDPDPQIEPAVSPVVSKVIIVAGGGPYPGNTLWEATRMCANYAYRAMLYQGYTRENIYYLTADADFEVDGLMNNVDGDATYENLSYAINVWAKDPKSPAHELLVYITDHGGNGTFRLNPTQLLHAEALDDWLDALQETMPGKLIFIYDACRSGTFLCGSSGTACSAPVMGPPEGKERIIITSASDEPALFMPVGRLPGGLSFSFQFWAHIYYGAKLDNAFFFAKDMMEDFQSALLDADGNGVGNEYNDRKLAGSIIIGRGYQPASDIPLIEAVSESQTLYGETSAELRAGPVIDADGISRVWAVIKPPGYTPESPDIPVTDLPTAELADTDHDGIYEGNYNGFDKKGTYHITVYAADNTEPESVCSFPMQTTVVQAGYTELAECDITGDGKTDLKDGIIALAIVSGMKPAGVSLPASLSELDVSGDGKIGVEEAVHILLRIGNF